MICSSMAIAVKYIKGHLDDPKVLELFLVILFYLASDPSNCMDDDLARLVSRTLKSSKIEE